MEEIFALISVAVLRTAEWEYLPSRTWLIGLPGSQTVARLARLAGKGQIQIRVKCRYECARKNTKLDEGNLRLKMAFTGSCDVAVQIVQPIAVALELPV